LPEFLNRDGRLLVLSDGGYPITDMDVFLGGSRRVREYAFYHDALAFHAQDDAYAGSFGI